MKKILFLSLSLFLFAGAFAQRPTQPRWGGGANNDNTGRAVTYQFDSLYSDVAHDTVYYTPLNTVNQVFVKVTDSVRFEIRPRITTSGTYQGFPAPSYVGDRIEMIINGPSGGYVTIYPGKAAVIKYAGTVTLSAKGVAILTLQFDGAYWDEVSRVVQ